MCMPKTALALLQLPPTTAVAIEKLGADLAVARLRRKESLKTWAKRMGVSVCGSRGASHRHVKRPSSYILRGADSLHNFPLK